MTKQISHCKVRRLSFPPALPPTLSSPPSPEKNGPVRGVAGPEKAGEEKEKREHREGDDAEQVDFDVQLPRSHAIGTEQVEGAMHRALGIRFDGHGWHCGGGGRRVGWRRSMLN